MAGCDTKMIFRLVMVLCFYINIGAPAKILLLPFAWKSHVFEISAIGEGLVARGHHISIVLPPTYPDFNKTVSRSVFEVIPYTVKDPDLHMMEPEAIDDLIESVINISPISDFRQHFDGFKELCSNLLSDEAFFRKIEEKTFDLVIVDVFPCSRCNLILPYRLELPYVSLTTTYEPWLLRNPALPSFVPFPLAQYYSDKMSFTERILNLYTLMDWSFDTRIPYISDDSMQQFLKGKPFKSLDDLARNSKLWLLDTDLLLDYPRPIMPNEINIGGLSTKPAKPLPDDIKQFVESTDKGVIIVSFGSFDLLGNDQDRLKKFLNAFEKVPQNVVFRSSLDANKFEYEIPPNVLIKRWIPQNDLLGHPNTKLFITHCGANGQFEALYHGVPMLGFPIFADQPYNARRHTYHGFGLYMDLLSFDGASLQQNIENIITNRTYYDNIKKASAIFHSRLLKPVDRAVYHIEQVLEHGAVHLHSHALDMPWYEYLMLDILALFCLLFILSIISLYFIMFKLIRKCCFHEQKSKRD